MKKLRADVSHNGHAMSDLSTRGQFSDHGPSVAARLDEKPTMGRDVHTSLPPFHSLHRLHAASRLLSSSVPPRERGTIWSTVVALTIPRPSRLHR
jgi:hypothetical protein